MKLPRGPTLLRLLIMALALLLVLPAVASAKESSADAAGSTITLRFSEATTSEGGTTTVKVAVVEEEGWVVSEQTLDLGRSGHQLTLLVDGTSVVVSTHIRGVNPLRSNELAAKMLTIGLLTTQGPELSPIGISAESRATFEGIEVQGGSVAMSAQLVGTCVPCHR